MSYMKRCYEDKNTSNKPTRRTMSYPRTTKVVVPPAEDFKTYTVGDHTVSYSKRKWHCSCKHFKFRCENKGRVCKHILEIFNNPYRN